MSKTTEAPFQQHIINAFQQQGWLVGTSSGYQTDTALYPEDALAYIQRAHPEQWQRFSKNNANPETAFIQALAKNLDKQGTLNILRHGFKSPSTRLTLCSFKPDHDMNPSAHAQYQANRLRIVPEVSYSPHVSTQKNGQAYNPRLDLVLFVNGIPTATLELKSDFTQALENAKRQYQHDRPTKDPITRKPEPLLNFKRGAFVHFAVSQTEIAMTSKLDGKKTRFLPFNQGHADGGAGNPNNDTDYPIAYLWHDICQPEAWLNIIGRFLHQQRKIREDFNGCRHTEESLIFPRFHQWQVVTQLVNATRNEGTGHRYLIQHSAGSGKSNSIAWLAHQLAALYDDKEQKLFNSVIVVTDRTVLDEQLQETIYQFEHAMGVVCPISRDIGSKSKSQQLAEALIQHTRIIIVTIQTFPALFSVLENYPNLANGRYAVIADEAHSSQTGSTRKRLEAVLNHTEQEEVSDEDTLNQTVATQPNNISISYYAFTATPKAKTLELFGRTTDPTRPPSKDNLPTAYHVYSMRQAIEEGFILDVLKNYVTYDTAWKLSHPDGDEKVDKRQARKQLAQWVRLHPYNIEQRVIVIVEHFRQNVRFLLDGQAKAMLVTASRKEAVRYQLAMQAYVKEKGYEDVIPLVAFSGSVPPDDHISAEVSETSTLLNPMLKGRDMREAFDTQDFNVLIAANKFQTGFDQPKLCAMYVDKKLNGVDCVQTLSRLNRLYAGKQTFILDFVNQPEEIVAAFEPYYLTAQLSDVSDPNVLFNLQTALDEMRIYHWEEVRAFAKAFFDRKASATQLIRFCQPARQRFIERYQTANEEIAQAQTAKQKAQTIGDKVGRQHAEQALATATESRNALDLFKKNLQSFSRVYEFITQLMQFDDEELEQLNVFAKHLSALLRTTRLTADEVDLEALDLTHYRLTKCAEHQLRLKGEGELDPITDVGSGQANAPEQAELNAIIQRLNEIFGAEVSDADQLHYAQGIAKRVYSDDAVMAEVRNNSPEQVMRGRYPKALGKYVLDALQDHEKMTLQVLENQEREQQFAEFVLQMVLQWEQKGSGSKNISI